MGFTDYAADLLIDGVTYAAVTGYASTTIASTQGLAVDNMEVDGALDSAAITEYDITAGKYRYAQVNIFQVDYTDLPAGKQILRTGYLGEITRGDHSFKAEIRGLAQLAQRNIGQLYSEKCRADLGDRRCQVDLVEYTHTGVIVAGGASSVIVQLIDTVPAAYFANGILTVTSGVCAGVSMEVSTHAKNGADDVLTLFLALPAIPAIGDTVAVQAGCTKDYAVCRNTFGNYLNFRGEPGIPGNDKIYTNPANDPHSNNVKQNLHASG